MKRSSAVLVCLVLISACNPTIRIEPGAEPIRIEANITINHEIKIVVEREVEAIFEDDELF